jgi:hypothetical protein
MGVSAVVQQLSVVCRAAEATHWTPVDPVLVAQREMEPVELSLARAESAQVEVRQVVPGQD